jgi:[acyl-carrier-protein] S-malonyltransferase
MKSGLAFVFPGQGSQYVGMGNALLEAVPDADYIFSMAEELTGIHLKKLCIEGPMEELTDVENLQPCLATIEIICCIAALKKGLKASAVAGHSLGEYPALWAAGVIGLEDTLNLVHARGKIMKEVGDKNPGSMAAVIGFSRKELEKLIEPLAKKGTLVLANHNSPEQIVVTGEIDLIGNLCKKVKTQGAKAIPLKVSGAYHSPLMKEAAERFAESLDKVSFYKPKIPIYSNVTAKPESNPEKIKDLMKKQICSAVRWYDIVINMKKDNISNFLELGPKKILGNLIKKCLPEGAASVFQGENFEDFEICLKTINK